MAKQQEQSKVQVLWRRRDVSAWLALVGGILGVLGSVFASIIFPSDSVASRRNLDLKEALAQVEKEGAQLRVLLERSKQNDDRLHVEIAQTAQQLEVLQATLESARAGEDSGKLGRELAEARKAMETVVARSQRAERQIRQFDARLAQLEDVILADPEKAVSLPLLRRDIKALEQQATKDVESMRAENARVYDLMKWLIGLMALVSLSLIGTAAGNVFKREAAKEEANLRPKASDTSQAGEVT